ncbi:Shiga toxin A subunit [Enterobacteriaceae bacterium 89]|nr:Shiga toxin A subunit [Enterobacteriaceae bacterium 89]
MIRALSIMFALAPTFLYAATLENDCAVPGQYVEGMLLTSIKNDLGVDLTTIQYKKTVVEVLSVEPVSNFFAHKLAGIDSKADIDLTEKDYYGIYHNDHVENVTAKYTFTNINNKRSVYISSALANKDECSVRYNGYLTLSREF